MIILIHATGCTVVSSYGTQLTWGLQYHDSVCSDAQQACGAVSELYPGKSKQGIIRMLEACRCFLFAEYRSYPFSHGKSHMLADKSFCAPK